MQRTAIAVAMLSLLAGCTSKHTPEPGQPPVSTADAAAVEVPRADDARADGAPMNDASSAFDADAAGAMDGPTADATNPTDAANLVDGGGVPVADAAADRGADAPPPDAAVGACSPVPVPAGAWQPLPTRMPQEPTLSIDPLDTDGGYSLSAGQGLLRTPDGGRTWCHIPTPGEPAAVYVAPNAPQVLYLVATPGGQTSAVLHRSDNRGQSWVALPRNPIRSATTDRAARRLLVIHPSDPRTAYALEEAVVSKTVDGGQTWKPLSLQVRATGLVIDRSKPDHVYAWYPMRNSIDGEILMRSLDGGTTWSGAGYMPRTFYDRDAPLPALAIDNDSRLLVRDIDGFMMQSTDDGATWTRPLTFGKGHPFAFASSAPKTLYTVMDASSVTIIKTTDGDSWNQTGSVGGAVQLLGAGRSEGSFFVETRVGVARTLDEGRTWSVPVPDARGLFFAVSAAASGTLYQIKNNGVVRSTDGGQTFTARTGIPPTGAQLIKAVAADTGQTRTLYSSWLLTNLNDEAGFRSTDGGETWAPWPVRATEDAKDRGFIELASPRARPSTIYANVQYGLRKTIDGGVTWTKVFAEPVWAMAVAPSDGDVVFVKHVVVPGAGLKVKKTIDGGKTWTDVNIDAFNPYALEGITIDPVDPKVVYLGLSLSEGAAVARSNDGGVTWTKLGAGLPPARSLAIAPTRPSTLYFGSYGGAIHRSLDSGLTWTRIDRRTDGDSAFPTVDPMDPRTVYVLLKSDSNTSVYSGRLLRTVTGGE